jgi:hypothetical protein
MGASGIYALRFPVEAGNPKPLKDIAEAASRIAQQTKVSSAEFKIFQDELTRSIAKGGKMSSVLAQITREFQNSTPALKSFTIALRDEVGKSLDAVAIKTNTAIVSMDRMERSLGRIGARIGGQLGIGGGGGFIGGQLGSVLGLGLGGGLAVAGVGALADYIEKTAKASQETTKLAEKLQITRGAASEIIQAFGAAGLQANEYASGVEALGHALEAGGAKSQALIGIIQSLGISFTDTFGKGRGDADVFSDLIHKVAGMTDETKRSFIGLYSTIEGSAAGDKLREQAAAIGDQNTKLAILNLTVKDIAKNTKSWTEELMDVFGLLGDIAKWKPSRFLLYSVTRNSADLLGSGQNSAPGNITSPAPFTGLLTDRFDSISNFVGKGSAQYRIPTTQETLARAASEARSEYDKALNASLANKEKGITDTDTIQRDNQALSNAQAKYEAAQRASENFRNSQRSGESLAKRRQQLREELSQEGAKPGSLARFQFKYRELRNGSAADQAAYYSGFQDLFQTINSRPIKNSELSEFSADQAVRSAGLKSSASLGRNFFDDFPGLSGITSAGLPPASASILTQGLQSQLRFRSRLARVGNQSPEAVAKAEAQDTIQTLQQEQAEREKELEAADKSTRKMGDIADLRQKYLDKITDAENDYTLKLKEIAEERKRSFGDSFSSLVISAQNGGARGVQGFLRGTGEGIESKILSNLASNFIFPKIQNAIPHAGDANSTIGKLLAGTPFGAKEDPLKFSTDLNTKSTDMNTAALLANYNALTGKSVTMPGGVGGISIPGLSTFGSDMNGLTGRGGLSSIFRSFGGGGGSNGGVENGGTGGDSLPIDSGGSGLSLGKIAAVGGAALGAYKGIDDLLKGGAKRKIGGVGELLGSAAGIAAMIPGGQAVALGLGIASGVSGLVSALLPDPRQQRINQISKTMFTSQYLAPQAIKLTAGSNGGYSDVDQFGNVRSSSLSPYPIVSNPYLDVPRRTDVPGHTISPFGGYSNQTGAQVNVTVHAMDSKSFMDHSDEIAGAVQNALKSNYHPLIKTVRDQL